MFYDVSVTRTSTASLTIRVEANDPDAAREKALELAGDQDYTGCVVEYDFDADSAVEVKDDNAPSHADATLPEGYNVADETAGEVNLVSEEKRCPDLGDGTCALCPTIFQGVSDAIIDAGWVPSYWIGEEEQDGPVCPNCAKQFLVTDAQYGESVLNLKGEYVSQWDGGVEVKAPCTVDPRTRKVVIEHAAGAEGLETLHEEYVLLNGEQYVAVSEEERHEYSPEEQSRMFFWS